MGRLGISFILISLAQVLLAASLEDKYEPMVAFICDRPAMHRGVNGWIPDKSTDCLSRMEDILAYCQTIYPDHNITNVVEASKLFNIPDWPMKGAGRALPHRVRPFRCLVGGFQSDALLVPQHCEFDHKHDQTICQGFSHWNRVAEEACELKGTHLESLGMLLNCDIGKFCGVEYVCCPNPTKTVVHPQQDDDKPDEWEVHSHGVEEEEDDKQEEEEATTDWYEAYLRGQDFPRKYGNEHKKFLAAKDRMKKNQQAKVTKLLQEWQAAREHVNEVRKTDPKTADTLAKEITTRFQSLYAAYEQEDEAERQQLIALHQQHVQAALNEKKREAMDKYLNALEGGDMDKIVHYLQSYIKAEEKDRMHTVNHYEHVKYTSMREAVRIHPFIVNHLRLSEQRIDQALEMLTRYPDVEVKVRPEIEEFMTRFNTIANSIRDIVLPMPHVDEPVTETNDAADHLNQVIKNSEQDSSSSEHSSDSSYESVGDNSDFSVDDDEVRENEHDYLPAQGENFARHMEDTHSIKQGFAESAVTGGQVGSTIGIALGSVSVFVIIVVAIIMLKRRNPPQGFSHGYVEVDPSASPADRHLANMQMNGYENPTYKYFEVQTNPQA